MSLHIISASLFVYTTAQVQDRSGVCDVSWVNQKMILECCVDFQLINGACKPCIGRHGVNCTSPCRFGYFGFGCQQRCNCSDRQGCDRHTGCFEYKEKNDTSFYGVAVFVTIVMTSLFWGGVIVVNKTYGDKIRALFNQRQQDDIRKENYDDIRESRMMLKTSDGSNSVAPLHRMTAGSCPRGSDNYHHLISTKVIPKQLHSNVYNAKLKQTEDQSCNKLSKTDITDDYFTLVKKESNNA